MPTSISVSPPPLTAEALEQKDKNAQLHEMALNGDLTGVQEGLIFGADPLSVNSGGENALMLAAQASEGAAPCIQALLSAAPQAALARDRFGGTALIQAVWNGDLDCAQLLLPLSDINARDNDGLTVLMIAAMRDDVEAIEMLLPHVDARARSDDGRDAFFCAAQNGSVRSLQRLRPYADLFHGLMPSPKNHWLSKPQSVLNAAAAADRVPSVRFLLDELRDAAQREPQLTARVQEMIDESLAAASRLEEWPAVDCLAQQATRQRVEELFAQVGAEKMPQWAARVEREELAGALSHPAQPTAGDVCESLSPAAKKSPRL